MAFNSANLTALCYGNGFTLWHYTSTDAIATVNTSGYFNDAANMMAVRDVVIVCDSDTPTTSFVSVLSNDGSTVDVSDGTAIAETDTD